MTLVRCSLQLKPFSAFRVHQREGGKMQLADRLLVKFGHGLGLPSRYKLLKKIGAGAEGEVWVGLDEEAQTMVAVKLIPRGAPAWKLDMAKRELYMLAQLGPGHLNIVRPLEIVLTSKYLALITEYVPGGSLSDHLARHALCEDVARYYFRQLLSALAFCHSRKIVYRDVKPANVLITGTHPPFLKMCDFGLADSWAGRSSPTFKSLVGTPGYMAPEIMASFFTGAAELARRSRDAAAAKRPGTVHASAPAGAAAVAVASGAGETGTGPLAAAAAATEAGAAARAGSTAEKPKAVELKPSASGKLTSAVAAAAAAAVAAARAAAAAVPVSRSGSFGTSSSSVAAGPQGEEDPAAAELLDAASYDAEQADVYSLGVLLVVMMLRSMPWNYDAYAQRLPLLKAMKALYDIQVCHRVSWRDATPKAASLSEPLAALLDSMLVPDPQQRATLQDVAASPWVNMPLPKKLQCGLEVLSEQQELREARYVAAAAAAGDAAAADISDSSKGTSGVPAAVQQQLDAMLEAAKTVAKGRKLHARLVLSQVPLATQAQAQKIVRQQERQQRQQQGDDRDVSSEECCTAAIITAPTPAVTSGRDRGTGGGVRAPPAAAGKAGPDNTSAADVSVQVA